MLEGADLSNFNVMLASIGQVKMSPLNGRSDRARNSHPWPFSRA